MNPSGYAVPRRRDPYGAFGGVGRVGPATAERQRAAGSLWLSRSGEVELLGGLSDQVASSWTNGRRCCSLVAPNLRDGELPLLSQRSSARRHSRLSPNRRSGDMTLGWRGVVAPERHSVRVTDAQ